MSEKQKKMTWKEIKKNYPDEWVEIVNFDEDENGYVINGFVICHNKNKRKFPKLFFRKFIYYRLKKMLYSISDFRLFF